MIGAILILAARSTCCAFVSASGRSTIFLRVFRGI